MEDSMLFDPPFGVKSNKTKRTYRCPDCHRNFKRREHCARHQRTHTRERPFPCQYCGKTYARKDMVKRHEQTLHPQGSLSGNAATANGPKTKKLRSDSGSSDTTESSNLSAAAHSEELSSSMALQPQQQQQLQSPTKSEYSIAPDESSPFSEGSQSISSLAAPPWPGPTTISPHPPPAPLHPTQSRATVAPLPTPPLQTPQQQQQQPPPPSMMALPADYILHAPPHHHHQHPCQPFDQPLIVDELNAMPPRFYQDMQQQMYAMQTEPFPGDMIYLMDQELQLGHPDLPLDDVYIPIDPQLG